MSDHSIRLAIITNIITTYREGFYNRIFALNDFIITVYCQDKMPGMNLISIHSQYPNNVKIIKYLSANKEKIVWQFLPWREIITNNDVIFVPGNPRVLSDVVFGTFLLMLHKKVIIWTMAHSFRNNNRTESIRLWWTKLFPFIFVYTDQEVDFLKKKGFKSQFILGMNNGLDQEWIDEVIGMWPEERLLKWQVVKGWKNKNLIVSSSRLVRKNKYDLMLNALPKIVEKFADILWLIIGSGEEEDDLKELACQLGVLSHVHFAGSIYNEEEIAPYFLSSKLFIHPASIGLSLLHAFGYGLPVVTHNNSETHGPEYSVFESDKTGKTYRINDVDDLAATVCFLLQDSTALSQIKTHTQKIARTQYNVNVMVQRFDSIAKQAFFNTKSD